MKYALGPIALFRYEHSNKEVWNKNNPISVVSETYDDGDDYNLNAQWDTKNVTFTINGKQKTAKAPIYPTSYWNPVYLKSASKLLNTQKGLIENIIIDDKGIVDFKTANGTVKANHYIITADFPINVWYDAKTKEWIGLEFKVRGSDIKYERIFDE